MVVKKNKFLYSLTLAIVWLFLFSISCCFANILSDWNSSAAYKPNPVLFLHGINCNSQVWQSSISDLRKWFSKYEQGKNYLETLDFQDSSGSIDTYPDSKDGWADRLNYKVNELLNSPQYEYYTNKLNLVSHSMGGLAAREYLSNTKYPSGYIDKLILIGVPNLGSNAASRGKEIITVYNIGSIISLPLYTTSIIFRDPIDSFAKVYWIPSIQVSEGVKDMLPGSKFLNTLNNIPQNPNVQYYGIYGIIGHFLNKILFGDYYGGDGIVSEKSQLGTERIFFKEPPKQITAFHINEPAMAVSGDNPLLKFLDSTTPALEITSPIGPPQTTETSIRIQGKVYKEYLPADTELIINITRINDNYVLPQQTSFLKSSDLWIPNNPDSPVAEFDERLNLPGNGIYLISCQVRNPASLTSNIIYLWVNVVIPVQNASIIVHCHNPEGKEIASIQGVSQNAVQIYDNDNFIGYGAYNNETHNKPIEVSAESHTVKVKFNGMIREQIVTPDINNTTEVIFTFDRADFDLLSLIRRIYGGHSVVNYSYAFSDKNTVYTNNVSYWEDNFLISYKCKGIYVQGSASGYAELFYDGISYLRSGKVTSETIDYLPISWPLTSGIKNYVQITAKTEGSPYCENDLVPSMENFDRWFIQTITSGHYPYICIRTKDWQRGGCLIQDSFDGYQIHYLDAHVTYDVIEGNVFTSISADIDFECPKTKSFEYEWRGSASDLKMSSVPYDITGTGI